MRYELTLDNGIISISPLLTDEDGVLWSGVWPTHKPIIIPHLSKQIKILTLFTINN